MDDDLKIKPTQKEILINQITTKKKNKKKIHVMCKLAATISHVRYSKAKNTDST